MDTYISERPNELISMVGTRTMGTSEVTDAEFVLRQVEKSKTAKHINYMQTLKSGTKIMKSLLSLKQQRLKDQEAQRKNNMKNKIMVLRKNPDGSNADDYNDFDEEVDLNRLGFSKMSRKSSKYQDFPNSYHQSKSHGDYIDFNDGMEWDTRDKKKLYRSTSEHQDRKRRDKQGNEYGKGNGRNYNDMFTDNIYEMQNEYSSLLGVKDSFSENNNLKLLDGNKTFAGFSTSRDYQNLGIVPKSRNMDSSSLLQMSSRNAKFPTVITVSKYLQTLGTVFLKRFCIEELFSKESKFQLVSRIKEGVLYADPELLKVILDRVVVCCKSTKLNLNAVSLWTVNELESQSYFGSIIDYIFVINNNIMKFDIKYNTYCLDKYCINPICTKLHTNQIKERDKARAFFRLLNMVLNEAIRTNLIKKEQKLAIRSRVVKKYNDYDDRVQVIRELSALILIGRNSRYAELATRAIVEIGVDWIPSPSVVEKQKENGECSLDPQKVYNKAIEAFSNPYLESILDVSRLNMGISASESKSLIELWENLSKVSQKNGKNWNDTNRDTWMNVNDVSQTQNEQGSNINSFSFHESKTDQQLSGFFESSIPSKAILSQKKLTLPMILYILVYYNEEYLNDILMPYSKIYGSPESSQNNRINVIEETALQVVMSLGLTWNLSDNSPHDLRLLCVAILLELGSIFQKLVMFDTKEHKNYLKNGSFSQEKTDSSSSTAIVSMENSEIGDVDDDLFNEWYGFCFHLVNCERENGHHTISLLILYMSITSDRLLSQKPEFNPELFLAIVLDLLTEYRKRRPDYTPLVVHTQHSVNTIPSYPTQEAFINQIKSMQEKSTSFEVSRNSNGKINGTLSSVGNSLMANSNQTKKKTVSMVKPPNSAKNKSSYHLNRATREAVGSDFDRLYAWIDKIYPQTSLFRSILKTPVVTPPQAQSHTIPNIQNGGSGAGSDITQKDFGVMMSGYTSLNNHNGSNYLGSPNTLNSQGVPKSRGKYVLQGAKGNNPAMQLFYKTQQNPTSINYSPYGHLSNSTANSNSFTNLPPNSIYHMNDSLNPKTDSNSNITIGNGNSSSNEVAMYAVDLSDSMRSNMSFDRVQ
ncbi:hypothetical protein BB558_002315 [Smittium angustum]|uniref:Uncharacterized protein n=1 Tax=Smittium angustum TaxID=133377 RepID=A0A2U1J906_SMIAN|nr:hypothetical protein BB558_002315 [Smittium angustum]